MKSKILDNISAEEALIILKRLAKNDPTFAKRIEKEADLILSLFEMEDVCEDVYSVLDGIDVHELWDRSGASRYGYTSPEEMAIEMIESELEPYKEDIFRFINLKKTKEARVYCMGVLKGIYKYSKESTSEFKDWSIDCPEEYFGYLLEEWKERIGIKDEITIMNDFINMQCIEWSKWAIK